MQTRQQEHHFHRDDLVVRYTADVVTEEFQRALRKLNANTKGSAVHIVGCYTSGSWIEHEKCLGNLGVLADHDHRIYTHVLAKNKRLALETLPY